MSFADAMPRFELLHTSFGLPWQDLSIFSVALEAQPETVKLTMMEAHAIVLMQHGQPVISGFLGDIKFSLEFPPNIMSLIPHGTPTEVTMSAPNTEAFVGVSAELVTRTALEHCRKGGDYVELVPCYAFFDPLVQHICLSLLEEIKTGSPLGPLYADTMAQALAVHLLRHYASSKLPAPGSFSLPTSRLKLIQSYIRENMQRRISLAELAALSGLSAYHFARAFKERTGQPPHQYLICCRVERAKELLLQGNLTLAQVAQEVGFSDQSHLNRHVKRVLGVLPKDISPRL